MINFKNVIENSIYIVLIGVALIINNYVILGRFENMVESAIAKETTKIEHNFLTEIKKLKTKGEGITDFTITPDIKSKATTIISKDSVPKKKGFFKRLFGGKE